VDELLSDEQQAERVKDWLSENGLYLVGGLVLGLGGIFGYDKWQDSQLETAAAASVQYEEALVAIRLDQEVKALELVANLEADYDGSPYVYQAHLMLARMYMDAADTSGALTSLQKIIDEARDDNVVHIARLRLARVHVQLEDYDGALATLEAGGGNSAFSARYHDTRGDVFHAMGNYSGAQMEYALALADDRPGVVDRSYVQVKLDDVSGAGVAVDEPSQSPDADEAASDEAAASEEASS
jgi:predicted negative regulator of RcsB-dependent stress response